MAGRCPFCHGKTKGQPCGRCGSTWGEFEPIHAGHKPVDGKTHVVGQLHPLRSGEQPGRRGDVEKGYGL